MMVSVNLQYRERPICSTKTNRQTPLGVVIMNFHLREVAVNLFANRTLYPIAKMLGYKVCPTQVEAEQGNNVWPECYSLG